MLDDKEKKDYIEEIRMLYSNIDDDIIVNRFVKDYLGLGNNMRALDFKYRKAIYEDIVPKEDGLYLYNKKILDKNVLSFEVYNINIIKDNLIVDGSFNLFLNCNWDVFAKANGEYIKMNRKESPVVKSLFSFDGSYFTSFYNCKINIFFCNE